MNRKLLLCGLTIFAFFSSAQNFTGVYTFSNVTASSGTLDPTPVPVVQGLLFKPFLATHPAGNSNASGRFSFTGWPVGATNADNNYGNFTAALSPTLFYEVSLEVLPGYTLQLENIDFRVRRSGTGIRNYCVRSSLDNYTNNLAASTGTNSKLSVILNNIFFWRYDSVSTSSDQRGSAVQGGSSFSAITGTVNFRFFAWNAEAYGGTFSIDDVRFIGLIKDSLYTDNPLNVTVSPTIRLNIFPQPVHDRIFIQGAEQIRRVEVLNAEGRVVYNDDHNGETLMEIKTAAWSNGIYILSVSRSDGSTQHQKILIHH